MNWITKSISKLPEREIIKQVLASALSAVDPYNAVTKFIKRDKETLIAGSTNYDLNEHHCIYLMGIGKASVPMTEAVVEILGNNLTNGWLITKEGHTLTKGFHSSTSKKIHIFEASHPVPDERGVLATQTIIQSLSGLTSADLVIILISGGGSSLFTHPIEGIDLSDIQELTKLLLGSGATIEEINCIRKHLDTVKGGGLARLLFPARVITLILSDVVGDPLDKIASGPTTGDPSTFSDVKSILSKYNLWNEISPEIQRHIQLGLQGKTPETPKPLEPIFENIQHILVGNNQLAAQASLATADKLGLNSLYLGSYFQGEAREFSKFLAGIAKQVNMTGDPICRPACIIAGGETTVTLRGTGIGGRNQEIALGCVPLLADIPGCVLATLATDGGDGSSPAAGAVVTGETLQRSIEAGLNVDFYLANNDSYTFFRALGDAFVTGPTQTNVNDLAILFLF